MEWGSHCFCNSEYLCMGMCFALQPYQTTWSWQRDLEHGIVLYHTNIALSSLCCEKGGIVLLGLGKILSVFATIREYVQLGFSVMSALLWHFKIHFFFAPFANLDFAFSFKLKSHCKALSWHGQKDKQQNPSLDHILKNLYNFSANPHLYWDLLRWQIINCTYNNCLQFPEKVNSIGGVLSLCCSVRF